MHVLEVSRDGATVRIKDGCLAVEVDGAEVGRVPVAEVAVVLLAGRRSLCSTTAMAELSAQGTPIIFCDATMRPAGMVLPFRGQHEIGSRIAAQASAPVPRRRRLWKAIVRAKVMGQAAVLRESTGSDHGLALIAKRVRCGDCDNAEATAARRYWRRLCGDEFRRNRGEDATNAMLDYGYAVLRGAVARAICVAGLHPSLGIHHHHRGNAFALADDLIEPFRPVVDKVVTRIRRGDSGSVEITPATKRQLAGCLTETLPFAGETRTVIDAVGKTATSLAGAMLGDEKAFTLPWTS